MIDAFDERDTDSMNDTLHISNEPIQDEPTQDAFRDNGLAGQPEETWDETWDGEEEEEVYVFPLSFAQQRLWFLDQFEPNSPFYNIPAAVRLTGPLDVEVMRRALNEIVRRHETLRTTFDTLDGEPVQVIHPEWELEVPVIDLTHLPAEEREAKALWLANEEAKRPFDLTKGPLLRMHLLRLAQDEHIALFTMHHIISDGWSMGVLIGEIGALYPAFLRGEPSPLPELPIQYADFAEWQRNWLQGEVLEEQLRYWKEQLEGELPVLELPTDRPRPAVQTSRGGTCSRKLPKPLIDELKALSQREGATLFMTLLAAFQVLLHRYSGQDDLTVGTPIANRNRAEIEGLIGFFVNTLVLRADLSGSPSFRAFLRQVRETTLDAYAHQDLPFEMLVEALQPERDMSHNPLFQVMFILQNAGGQARKGEMPGGLRMEQIDVDPGTATFDLTLSLAEEADGMDASMEFNSDLFDQATVERMLGHFENLLQAIVQDPDQPVDRLELLSPEEKRQILVEWNDTARDFPLDRCVHQLIEEQVARTPDAVAVVAGEERLTYAELNARANQLAHFLCQRGVGPEERVAIALDRSVQLIVAVLGVLKAGGAYLPLDPTYPAERLRFMLEDAQPKVLLTQESLATHLPIANLQSPISVVQLDADWPTIAQEPTTNLNAPVRPEHLVYTIYTSGSTGQAKGVLVEPEV